MPDSGTLHRSSCSRECEAERALRNCEDQQEVGEFFSRETQTKFRL